MIILSRKRHRSANYAANAQKRKKASWDSYSANPKSKKAAMLANYAANPEQRKAYSSKMYSLNPNANWLYKDLDDSSVDEAAKKVLELANKTSSKMLDKATKQDIDSFQAYTIRNVDSKTV